MGTTVTAAYVADDAVVVAHVGDSRCYLLRGGDLVRLTRDHSLVGELVARGKLTEEQAEAHPQRSVITRALGPEPTVQVDLDVYPARAGDLFLVCSDGLTSMVHEPEVKRLLQSGRAAGPDRPAADRGGQRGGRAGQHHRGPLPARGGRGPPPARRRAMAATAEYDTFSGDAPAAPGRDAPRPGARPTRPRRSTAARARSRCRRCARDPRRGRRSGAGPRATAAHRAAARAQRPAASR